MVDFWSLPVKTQAYYILVAQTGSYMYDGLYPYIDQEEVCANIVKFYKDTHGDEVLEEIQEFADESEADKD